MVVEKPYLLPTQQCCRSSSSLTSQLGALTQQCAVNQVCVCVCLLWCLSTFSSRPLQAAKTKAKPATRAAKDAAKAGEAERIRQAGNDFQH